MMIETQDRECPNCGEEVRERWQAKRKLAKTCDECGWESEPYAPQKRSIRTTRSVDVNAFPGFCYEVFDRYGYLMVSSQSFSSKGQAIRELQQQILKGKSDESAGPYTGILWPSTVKVVGEKYS